MFRLSLECPDDQDEVEWLFDLAFAPGRQALSSYQLREGVAPVAELCMVARDDLNVLAGAIRYWPIVVGDAAALLLGPVAVHPTYQGEGLGGLLIGETLTRGRSAGWKGVILIGDEPYYSRFGFSRAAAKGVAFPPPTNPDRVLARALSPDGLVDLVGLARRP
jgi:predicted N-acetyltransferase YhbS